MDGLVDDYEAWFDCMSGAREEKSLKAGFKNVDWRRGSDVRWKTVPDIIIIIIIINEWL